MLSLSARSLVTGPRSLLLCGYLFNSNSAMSSRRGNTRLQDSSQKRLKVLVDMDQVLCDFEGSFLTAYTETFPGEPYIPVQDRNTFYLSDQYVKLRTGLEDKVLSILESEGFFLNIPPLEGACEAVKEMSQMDRVDVFICTSPLTFYKYCLQEKFKWIEDHLGAEWINRAIITRDKTMVYGNVLIDDKPSIQGACDTPPWKHVLFTAPHNCNVDLEGRQRLDNWTDGRWRDIIEDLQKRI